jgi:cytidylate kinase
MNRAVAPLKPADDAITIDSSFMSIDEVFVNILGLMKDRGIIADFK